MKFSIRFAFISAILLLSATTVWAQTWAGTGSGSISGRLALDGKPLAGASVAVLQADIKDGRVAVESYVAAGQIVDENGKPVANAQFVVYPASGASPRVPGDMHTYNIFASYSTSSGEFRAGIPDAPSAQMGSSNSSGDFSVRNLSPGRYAMIILPDDRSSYYSEPVTFDAASSEAGKLRLRAHVGAGISGTAIIEGTADPKVLNQLSKLRLFVLAFNDDVFCGRTITLSADGSFEAIGFVPGHLSARLGQDELLSNFSLLRIEWNGTPLKENKLAIQDREQIKGLRFVIAYGTGVIRGNLVGVDGKALPGGTQVHVSARLTSGDSPLLERDTETDSRGHFEIAGLPDGDYTISSVYYTKKGQPALQQKQTVTVAGGKAPKMKLLVDLKAQPEQK